MFPGESHTDVSKALAFRLCRRVTLGIDAKSVRLVLSYPLKAITLNPCWSPVFEKLSVETYTAFDELVAIFDYAQPDQIERFLNDLVRKGFLEQRGVRKLADAPVVSVIIPVHDRPDDLSDCLQSLTLLDYPKDKLEIIVVDDASSDNTLEIAARFPVRVIAMDQNRQAPYCRNLAARQAGGEILAFIDSDCLAHPRWLLDLVPAFLDPAVGAVGGKVDSHYTTSYLDRYEKVRSSLDMGARPRRSTKTNPFFYVPSCNLLVKRNLFLELGGFKQTLVVGEDVDLCWRIQNKQRHIEYRPVGTVYHKHRNRLVPFCVRRFEYGTSEPILQRLHPDRRKFMVFSIWAVLMGFLAVACMMCKSASLLVLCAAMGGVQAALKYRKIRNKDIPSSFLAVLTSVFRSNAAYLYQYGCFISRYYLVGSFFLLGPLPLVTAIIGGVHLLISFVEFIIRKPRLNPIVFIFYFTLEQLSYQLGVWYESFRQLSFKAVRPALIGKELPP